MNPHRPKKPASDEYTTDEEEMIVYDVEDEIETNPDYVKENEDLLILDVGVSITYIFNGNFNAECAVRPPSKRVAAIRDDAILFCDLIDARIIEIRNVLPVPPGASKKYKPPLLLAITFIIVSYAVRCSNTSFGRLIRTNVCNSLTSKCVSLCISRSKMSLPDLFGAIILNSVSDLLAIVKYISSIKINASLYVFDVN
ncbi:uncharacterized protein TNCV_3200511 [Trichonephila clavipes]|nr:uncharacterized protein TNCV_3200511 [Trichonephila clavipes]